LSLPFVFVAKGWLLLGGGTGGGVGLPFAIGIRAQDKKDGDRSCNHASDDDQQEWAAEGLSLLRRRCGGGGHTWFDAECCGPHFLNGAKRVNFAGFLRKRDDWVWLFDGATVVECVVDVVNQHHPNAG
jgi:hypothetical protein